MAEKKKWSKKKKIAVILLSVLAALLILITAAGTVALNMYCKTAEYNVISTDRNVTLVAHRGFRAVAPENTAAAFEEAGKAGFWGTECDIYRTKDGVWVVSHDIHTYRMMDKSAFVEKATYDELMKMNVDNGSNIDKYKNLKFCSFEEYIKICKKYDMTAVIELKGKNNTEYYNELIDIVKQYGVDSVYISFHFENLEKIRQLSESRVYYLVKEIEGEDIELAKSLENCGIDFDGNREENFENGNIDKCLDQKIELGAWTINDEEVLNKLAEKGVVLITTDSITK